MEEGEAKEKKSDGTSVSVLQRKRAWKYRAMRGGGEARREKMNKEERERRDLFYLAGHIFYFLVNYIDTSRNLVITSHLLTL